MQYAGIYCDSSYVSWRVGKLELTANQQRAAEGRFLTSVGATLSRDQNLLHVIFAMTASEQIEDKTFLLHKEAIKRS